MYNILFIGTASVFVMPCFSWNESVVIDLLSFHFSFVSRKEKMSLWNPIPRYNHMKMQTSKPFVHSEVGF